MLNITKDTKNFNKINLDKIKENTISDDINGLDNNNKNKSKGGRISRKIYNSSSYDKKQLYYIKDSPIRNDLNLKYYTNITIEKLKPKNKYLLLMHKPRIVLMATNDKFLEHGYNLLNKYKNNENIMKIKVNINKNINYSKKYDISIIILGKDQLYSSKIFNFISRCGQGISNYIIYVILSTPMVSSNKNLKNDLKTNKNEKSNNLIANEDIYNYIINRTNTEYINKILVFTYQQKASNIQKYIMNNIIIQYNNIFYLNYDELEQYSLKFKEIFKL